MRLHEEAFRKFDSRSVPRCFRLGLRASDGRVYRQERTRKNRSVNVREKSDEDQEGPQGRQERQEGLQHHDHNPASEVTRLHYFSGHEPRAVSARSRGAKAARSFFSGEKSLRISFTASPPGHADERRTRRRTTFTKKATCARKNIPIAKISFRFSASTSSRN